jgi:uncharacterized protein (TIRG00374 family)
VNLCSKVALVFCYYHPATKQNALCIQGGFHRHLNLQDVFLTLPSNFVRQLVVCIVLSVAFYGAWTVFGGADEVWEASTRIGWGGWSAILGLSLLNYLLRFLRWDIYLRYLGHVVPRLTNLCVYLAGFGFTTTPGKVGEVIRSVYLKPFGVSYTDSLAVFFVERFVDMLCMVVVASMAAYAFAEMRWLVGLALLFTLALLPLVHSPTLMHRFAAWVSRLKSERVNSILQKLLNMLSSSSQLLRSGPLYIGFAVGLIAWVAEGVALYVVLELMGIEIPLMLAVGIYGVAILAGAVSFVPGGLGGTELVMGSLLVMSGVDAPVAVSAVIICRVATLWFAVALGLAFLTGMEMQRSRHAPLAAGQEKG